MSDTDTNITDIATRIAAIELELRRRTGTAVPVPPKNTLDLDAYTIDQFCARNSISRATYYVLKKRGLQPDETRVLDRIIITKEAAAEWRKRRTIESRRKRRA